MLTFSVNSVSSSDKYAMTVWSIINSNLGYFKKFNGERWQEAVHQTYELVIRSRNENYDDILPYIKKTARFILKGKQKEVAHDLINEDGDIAPVFLELRDYIDTENISVTEQIKDEFKELYLLDEESFVRLRVLFEYDEVGQIPNLKDLKIKNQNMGDRLFKLLEKYGADIVFKTLYNFFQELPLLIAERNTELTKEIVLKPSNYQVLEKLGDTPTIKDEHGNFYYIDKTTLTMSEGNPDYLKWDIVGSVSSTCDILKIDISEYMSKLYDAVYVSQGVSNKHIKWCGNKFKMITPAGEVYLAVDQERFLNAARIELILNIIANVSSVVALSPDYIYIKPIKTFQFDNIRVKFHDERVMDLPITVHIKKRKK